MCVGSGSRLILSMRFDTPNISQKLYGAEEQLMRTQGPTVWLLQMV